MNLTLQAFQYGQSNAYIDVLVYSSVLKLPPPPRWHPDSGTRSSLTVVTNYILLSACVG